MGKVYVVISGKGGVGKTTSAINLGVSMNDLGEEIIIVDANLTTPNLGLHLGSPIVPITLNHVINDKAKVEEAIYEHETGTKILPSSLSINELKNLNPDKLVDISRKLRKISDNVILDSSAGLGDEAKASIKAGDEIIIITNAEISAVTDALKTIKLAEQMDKKILGVIVTRYENKKWEMPLDTIRDMLEIPILGVVPEDDSVKESQRLKNAVLITHPKSDASKAYRRITKRILGHSDYSKKEDEDKKKKSRKSFFSRFLDKLGL